MDPDPEAGRDRGGGDLAAELLPPDESAEVVDCPDGGRDRRAEQQPLRFAAERQERQRRHEDPEEERDPAEPRHRPAVEPPRRRLVDDAEEPGHPPDGGRQENHDSERDSGTPEHLEVVGERLPHSDRYFVP